MRAWEECLFITDTLFGQASYEPPKSKNASANSTSFNIIIKEVSNESLRNELPRTIVSVVNTGANMTKPIISEVNQQLIGNSATFSINLKKATNASQLDGSANSKSVSVVDQPSYNGFDYNADSHAHVAIANAKYPIIVLTDITRSAIMNRYKETRAIKRKFKTQAAHSELPNKKKMKICS